MHCDEHFDEYCHFGISEYRGRDHTEVNQLSHLLFSYRILIFCNQNKCM